MCECATGIFSVMCLFLVKVRSQAHSPCQSSRSMTKPYFVCLLSVCMFVFQV